MMSVFLSVLKVFEMNKKMERVLFNKDLLHYIISKKLSGLDVFSLKATCRKLNALIPEKPLIFIYGMNVRQFMDLHVHATWKKDNHLIELLRSELFKENTEEAYQFLKKLPTNRFENLCLCNNYEAFTNHMDEFLYRISNDTKKKVFLECVGT
jgi:hypothetical protein